MPPVKPVVAVQPRATDKPGAPPARRASTLPLVLPLRRSTPPDAPYGLWELPGGFGTTVLK